jgi:hypothetical protein
LLGERLKCQVAFKKEKEYWEYGAVLLSLRGTGESTTLTPGRGEVSREKSSIFALLFALIGSLDILVHGSPASMFRSSWINFGGRRTS